MSERKVLNKYFPPNFDPSKIPRSRVVKDKQHTVRLMAPFSMRCNTCGEYIYKGRKFNARKETVKGEFYLSLEIYRFYIRCPLCAAEITFKTDPKNTDYVAEHGAKRNFEPWREEAAAKSVRDKKREQEEFFNPMKALENKSTDTIKEMKIMDALDDIRLLNAKAQKIDADTLWMSVQETHEKMAAEEYAKKLAEQEEDTELMEALLAQKKSRIEATSPQASPSVTDLHKDVTEAPSAKPVPKFNSHAKSKSLSLSKLGVSIKKKE